jgi:hypothetical protein
MDSNGNPGIGGISEGISAPVRTYVLVVVTLVVVYDVEV